MTNSEVIAFLAKSLRDPTNEAYSTETLAVALTVSKFMLVDMLDPNNFEDLLKRQEVTITQLSGEIYGFSSLSGIMFFKDVLLEEKVSSGRPVPLKRIQVEDLDKFRLAYTGGDQSRPVYFIENMGIYTLGKTSFTGIFHYIEEPATVTNDSTPIDIPERFVFNWLEIAQSVILSWEGQIEASEAKLRRQQETLLTKGVSLELQRNG